jgi:hypothetical protein
MRDYGVTYKSVSLIYDNSSAISLAQNPIFHGREKHIKVRHHFPRDHVEKGDILMKCIDIFTKPLDASCFAALPRGGGDLVFAIPMAWFERDFVPYHVYTLSYFHHIAFHHT